MSNKSGEKVNIFTSYTFGQTENNQIDYFTGIKRELH